MADKKPPGKVRVIFRRYRRDPRTGKILDARAFGYRAWPIQIDGDQLDLPL